MEVLPSPGLVPTSQDGGGLVHANDKAMTAPGTAPGFDSGSYDAPRTTDHAPEPVPEGPERPVGSKQQPTAWQPGGGSWVKA